MNMTCNWDERVVGLFSPCTSIMSHGPWAPRKIITGFNSRRWKPAKSR